MLTESKHFVAFRTLHPGFLSARRLVACGSGMELAGRTALLTGATGGLGRAIAKALAGRGREAGAERAQGARRSRRWPPSCRARATVSLPSDLAEPAPPRSWPPRPARSTSSSPTPACRATGRLADFTPEQVTGALRVNLEAPMLMARALFPAMIERGARPPRLHRLALGQGGQPPYLHLQRDQVRPARLRARAARGPRPDGVGVSLVSPGFIREAGMFADSGAKPPPGMGTGTPSRSAAAVVKAIERDKVEIAVAPSSSA